MMAHQVSTIYTAQLPICSLETLQIPAMRQSHRTGQARQMTHQQQDPATLLRTREISSSTVVSLHLEKLRMQIKRLLQMDLLPIHLQAAPLLTRHLQMVQHQTLLLQTDPLLRIPRQLNLLQKALLTKEIHRRAVLPAELP
jgi:hypothetical protein